LEFLHFKEKYPLFRLERPKSQMKLKNVDEIIAFLKEEITVHPVATYVGIFDHYAHTKSLKEGEIAEEIIDAKNILFCFGKELPVPEVLAIRPRSIGVCETKESFVVSFMEAPNPAANESMKAWIGALEL
jgi:hypothetical protein